MGIFTKPTSMSHKSQKDNHPCAVYVRTARMDTESIEKQTTALTQYANEHGLCVHKVYIDIQSGYSIERPTLQQLLKDFQSDLFQVILMKDYSRLSRKFLDAYAIEEYIEANGGHIVTLL